jgi:hypothetical protein
MRRILLYSSLVLLLFYVDAIAIEVEGISVPETVKIESAGIELVLNGVGVRNKSFVKVYVGALYLPDKLNNVEAILNDPGAKRITMNFLHKEISSDKIVSSLNKGISENNTRKEAGFFKSLIAKFKNLFRSVYKGGGLLSCAT